MEDAVAVFEALVGASDERVVGGLEGAECRRKIC
jgi:hypothetical protein